MKQNCCNVLTMSFRRLWAWYLKKAWYPGTEWKSRFAFPKKSKKSWDPRTRDLTNSRVIPVLSELQSRSTHNYYWFRFFHPGPIEEKSGLELICNISHDQRRNFHCGTVHETKMRCFLQLDFKLSAKSGATKKTCDVFKSHPFLFRLQDSHKMVEARILLEWQLIFLDFLSR